MLPGQRGYRHVHGIPEVGRANNLKVFSAPRRAMFSRVKSMIVDKPSTAGAIKDSVIKSNMKGSLLSALPSRTMEPIVGSVRPESENCQKAEDRWPLVPGDRTENVQSGSGGRLSAS